MPETQTQTQTLDETDALLSQLVEELRTTVKTRTPLVTAIEAVLPDLQHYAELCDDNMQDGPDQRLAALRAALQDFLAPFSLEV